MNVVHRQELEAREHEALSPDASFSEDTEGRMHSCDPDDLRTEYQRDRDKIIHCKAFRRLSHKTQVFLAPMGDHYRTRLTHTLEVAQISRTIARALALNEDLTEAIALGHDLGHTPFGHAGEDALCECLARVTGWDGTGEAPRLFHHNLQSLRVVERIENEGRGLNLTAEVRDGIACHTGDQRAETLEGRVVALSDRIAYVNHDVDDAMRAGMLLSGDLPAGPVAVLGPTHSARIQTMVKDCVAASAQAGDIVMSPSVWDAMMELRAFLFDEVYHSPSVAGEVRKAHHVVSALFGYYLDHVDSVPAEYRDLSEEYDVRAVTDFIAGMTDRYAIHLYESLFVPRSFVGDESLEISGN
jgi:dGTPase